MADFLLVLGYVSKRLFGASWHDEHLYRVSFLYVSLSRGAHHSKISRGRYRAILPRPFLQTIKYQHFRDSLHTRRIRCRPDNFCRSYRDFLSHGEASTFAASPRRPGTTGRKAFDNFSSPMSQDDCVRLPSGWDEISRTSSLKYDATFGIKINFLIQNGRLPVGVRVCVQETFWCVLA